MPSVRLLLTVLGVWLVSSVLIGMVVGGLLRRREQDDPSWRTSPAPAGNRGPGRTVTARTPTPRPSLVRPVAWLLAAMVFVLPPSVALSEDALPGDVLYPLKLMLEQARLGLETDTSDRVTLQLEFAARRLKELNGVVDGAPVGVTAELTGRLRRYTRAAASELRWVRAEPGDLVARDQVEAALAGHIETLRELLGERCARVPQAPCPRLRETVAASRELLGEVRTHRNRVAVRSRSRRPTDIEVGPTPPPPATPGKPSDPTTAQEKAAPTVSPGTASPGPRRPTAGPTAPTGAGLTDPRPSDTAPPPPPPPAPKGPAGPSSAPAPDSTVEPATPAPTPSTRPARRPPPDPASTPTPATTPTPTATPSTPAPTPSATAAPTPPPTTPTPTTPTPTTPTPTTQTPTTPTPTTQTPTTPLTDDESGSTTQTETPTATETETATEPEPTASPEPPPGS